jgi:hypothetical protein
MYCSDCRFWDPDGNDRSNEEGKCRRYAPRPLTYFRPEDTEGFIEVAFPRTAGYDRCGDFQEVEKDEKVRYVN